MGSMVGFVDYIVAIGFSLAASIICYLIYQFFYGSKHIGAGVHRTFLIGGPAITVLFLGIMTSIPLGLGLLGALSFVRFRTPIKDPAEIGFLLLLIASSIGAATSNYLLTGLLLLVVFIALGVQWLTRNRVTLFGRGHLMISVDQPSFPALEKRLTAFLKERIRGLNLETKVGLDSRLDGVHQMQSNSHGREVFNRLTDYDFLEANLGGYLKETLVLNRYVQVMAGLRVDSVLYDVEGTQDLADKASSAYTKEFLYSLSNTDREVLQKVDDALQRLDRKKFGVCVECGEALNRKRLEAVPWASHCLACQEKVEKGLL